ncbi:M23 family metallopeptidase [Dolichospermum circinale]|uniref:M23 family metallopeptidase n=1 Tax=Dolichospermum circinale TaxID=109265 RepID=UPI0023300AFC|nr:M23 family metallopeptidase [Dolichospermum circinale]MDB9465640.1 M23 family metallopeptidase [Dolichospermum circinale CS-539/09]MDB9469736.1 M23 family metallopeptidase [Dolichospermum circinale CS-539]
MSNRVKILLGIITAIPMALGLPAKALEVQIMPKNPQLGDTILVLIEADGQKSLSNPTVTVGEKNYPAFEIAPRQYRSFIPTTPLEKAGVRTIKVSEEGQEQKLSIQVRDRKFAVQRITLPPGKAGVKATQEELKRVAEFKALQTPEKYWNGVFLTPNAGRTSTRYGVRRYYNGVFANDYYHRGQDYAGAAGSSVTAPAAGRVALVGTVSQGFRVHGNVIGIDHGQGVVSIFMHLSRINVQEGDFVKAGQKIGAVGSTGASTGPHLHWGLYVNGQSVDPLPWKSQEIK